VNVVEGPELDGFSFDRVIGRGGTATVYLAVQAPFDRQVAIKIYQGQITSDQARRVFEKECGAIGRLSAKPGIAAFYAAGFLQDGAPYLVMQYYPKGSLANRVQTSGPLDVAETVGVARKIGRALAATHSAGIVHRDVKPENMLIDDDDQPVLADFGISAIGDVASSRSVMAFSPSHVAPEVLEGARAGESADLYSFASSLYTLLEGHAPFETSAGGHPGALLMRVLQQNAPPLTRTDVPPGMADLILRSLAKSPAGRPSDMTAFLNELEEALGRSQKHIVQESELSAESDLLNQPVRPPSGDLGDEATVFRSSGMRLPEVPSQDVFPETLPDAQGPLDDSNEIGESSNGQDDTVLRFSRPVETVDTAVADRTELELPDVESDSRHSRTLRNVLIVASALIVVALIVVGSVFRKHQAVAPMTSTAPATIPTTTTTEPLSFIKAAPIPTVDQSAAGTFGSPPSYIPPSGPPPSQLEVAQLIPGSGLPAASGSSATVSCWSWSYSGLPGKGGESSATFAIPGGTTTAGPSVPGIGQGLLGMKIGARRELIVPPDQLGTASGFAAPQGEAAVFICDRTG